MDKAIRCGFLWWWGKIFSTGQVWVCGNSFRLITTILCLLFAIGASRVNVNARFNDKFNKSYLRLKSGTLLNLILLRCRRWLRLLKTRGMWTLWTHTQFFLVFFVFRDLWNVKESHKKFVHDFNTSLQFLTSWSELLFSADTFSVLKWANET